MMDPDEREWFEGTSEISFADAAKNAVENAEEVFRGRGQDLPERYDVKLQVTARGVLSDYRVFVSPTP
jgi:flavin-binding protein dodecin